MKRAAPRPGCTACDPARGAAFGRGLPPAWQPFAAPADWGLAHPLRAAWAALWRCSACGAMWTARWDQYQDDHFDPQPLSDAAVAALRAPAGSEAVRRLLSADPPAFLLVAVLDATWPVPGVDRPLLRRLARRAGVERPDRPPRRR